MSWLPKNLDHNYPVPPHTFFIYLYMYSLNSPDIHQICQIMSCMTTCFLTDVAALSLIPAMHDRKGERKIMEVEIKDTMYNAVLEIHVGFESVQQKHLDKTEFHQQVMNFVKEAKFPKNGQLLDVISSTAMHI